MELKIPCGEFNQSIITCSVPIEKEGKFTREIAEKNPNDFFQYTVSYFKPDSRSFTTTTFLMNPKTFGTLNNALKENEKLAKAYGKRLPKGQEVISAESADIFLLGLKETSKTTTPDPESWIHSFDKPLTLTFRVRVRNPNKTFVEIDKTISYSNIPGLEPNLYARMADQIGDKYFAVAAETAPVGTPGRRVLVFLLTKEQMYQMDKMALGVRILSKEDGPDSIFTKKRITNSDEGRQQYVTRGTLKLFEGNPKKPQEERVASTSALLATPLARVVPFLRESPWLVPDSEVSTWNRAFTKSFALTYRINGIDKSLAYESVPVMDYDLYKTAAEKGKIKKGYFPMVAQTAQDDPNGKRAVVVLLTKAQMREIDKMGLLSGILRGKKETLFTETVLKKESPFTLGYKVGGTFRLEKQTT